MGRGYLTKASRLMQYLCHITCGRLNLDCLRWWWCTGLQPHELCQEIIKLIFDLSLHDGLGPCKLGLEFLRLSGLFLQQGLNFLELIIEGIDFTACFT
jgi:hypothetical protein